MKKVKDQIVFSDPLLFERDNGEVISGGSSGVSFEVMEGDDFFEIPKTEKNINAEKGVHLKYD